MPGVHLSHSASVEPATDSVQLAVSKPRVQSRRVLLIGYGLVSFLYWMALYLYAPTLPTYAKSKTTELALVGVILSMYGFWQMAIRLPVGIAADWLGRRKPFIIGGLILVGSGAVVMGLAQGWQGLLIGRSITGLSAATWVPLIVIFSALFDPLEAVKAAAILNVVGSIARIIATSVTGSLNQLGGYRLAFFLAAGVAALAVALVIPLKEVRQAGGQERRRPSPSSVKRLVTRRDVLLPGLLSAVAQFTNWATTFGFLPILAQGLGVSDVTISLMVSLSLVFLTLGNLVASAAAGRIRGKWIVYASFVVLSAGVAGTAIANTVGMLFVSQALIGLGTGLGYPVLMGMSIEYVADDERATAMGLHQSVYAAGMFAGPWLGGILASAMGVRPMFAATAAASLALGLLGTSQLRGRPPGNSPSPAPEQLLG
jgi:MFS family permease